MSTAKSKVLPHSAEVLVSVVIPMYQVAHVLDNCIAQLKAQTYKRLELLFVDDASPDDAAERIQRARPDLESLGMQVKLLRHQQNQGVAVARNTALEAATGEWIYSFDADDAMEPQLIERLVVRGYQTDCDIVGCDWYLRYEDNDRQMTQPNVRTGREMYEAMCYGIMKWNVWLFLVRRSLFESGEKLRFTPKDNMGEDMMLMCAAALRAQRVSIVQEPMYYYVKTNAVAQTANYRPEHWAQVDRNLKTLEEHIRSLYDVTTLEYLNFLKLNLKLPLLISSQKSDYQRWAEWYPEANGYVMKNPRQSIRTKLLQLAAARGLWPLVALYNKVVMEWLYKLIYK